LLVAGRPAQSGQINQRFQGFQADDKALVKAPVTSVLDDKILDHANLLMTLRKKFSSDEPDNLIHPRLTIKS
jgi:hypothetical protein